jgi:hypothetical protein
MGTRHAYSYAGQPVPAVSTLLALCKSDFASREMEEAAARGTAVHALVAADLRGEDTPPLEMLDEKVRRGFSAWLGWSFRQSFTVEAVEHQIVGPLFGGTMDAVLVDAVVGRVIVDLKATSKRDYSHFIQLGAYAMLWELANPGKPIAAGLVLRLDTTTEQPEEHWLSRQELNAAQTAFAGLVSYYHAREALKAAQAERRKANRKGAAGSGEAA